MTTENINDTAGGVALHRLVRPVTLCDPRNGGYPRCLDYTPDTSKGWMWWDREYREINEVHQTANGVQIELLA